MITIVFHSRAAFDAFRATTPATDENPFTKIGEPAYESTLEDGSPSPGSRVLVSHHFTAAEAAYLQECGANVRVGGPDGPAWPEGVPS